MQVFKRLLKYQKYVVFFGLLFTMYVFLIPKSGHPYDNYCWKEWAKFIFSHGLNNAYKGSTDYLPLYQYVLFLFGKFQGSPENIDNYIHYLRIVTLAFDFIAGFFFIRFINSKFNSLDKSFFYVCFLFLNIAFLYNSLIWGQVDGIMTCLVFMSFYFAVKQRGLIALIFMILSINFKLQAIIFLPLIMLLLIPALVQKFTLKRLLIWLFIPIVLEFLIVLPFLMAGDLGKVWKVVSGYIDNYPMVSANAYNLWTWLINGNLGEISDGGLFFSISYKHWGLLMFFSLSLLALIPLIKVILSFLFGRAETTLDNRKIVIIAALIPLLFFFCNTQMHERYSHPAIIFLALYSIMSGKYLPYILGSIAYVLNLEGVLKYFQLRNYNTFIFEPRFVSFIYFVTIIYLFLDLYDFKIVSTRRMYSNKITEVAKN